MYLSDNALIFMMNGTQVGVMGGVMGWVVERRLPVSLACGQILDWNLEAVIRRFCVQSAKSSPFVCWSLLTAVDGEEGHDCGKIILL